MTHEEINEKIFGLYDGPVTEKERSWVENHLSCCTHCSKDIEDYKNQSMTLFATPAYSELEEDAFTTQVMTKVQALSAKTDSLFEIIVEWLIPLLGSTIAAAWVMFSVLPNTPSLSNALNGSAFFESDAQEITPSAWTPVPVPDSNSNEAMVVSWMKE